MIRITQLCSIRTIFSNATRSTRITHLSTQSNYFLTHVPKDPAFVIKNYQILPDNKQLAIQWQQDYTVNHFHAMWLRHQCHCEKCTHITSGQRFQEPRELMSPVRIQNVRVSEDRVDMEWSNEEKDTHTGFLPLRWLHLQREYPRTDTVTQEPYKLCDMKFEDVMRSEEGLYEYLYKLNQHGVVQISNTPKGGVLTLADAISFRYDSYWGKEFEYGLKIDPDTLAYSNKALHYHLDLSYMQNRPGIAYLHCLQYDDCVEGGGLGVKDGFKIAEKFKETYPDHYRTLSTTKVKFAFYSVSKAACYVRETTHLQADANGELVGFNWAPNIQHSLSNTNNEQEVGKYTVAYHEFLKTVEDFPERVDIHYQAGVMAVFNNTRMLHMRNGLTLNEGVRHIHGCYSPIDEYRNKLRYFSLQQGHPLPKKIW